MLIRTDNRTITPIIAWIAAAILFTAARPLVAQESGKPPAGKLENHVDSASDRADAGKDPPVDWWHGSVTQSVLDAPHWVTFDLETVLLDTLRSSPRISSVSRDASIAMERIIQQDAAFDSTVLFESTLGRSSDPVGNTLVTGGADRLIEESLITRGGIRRSGRRGTLVDLSQELEFLDSNSDFFDPNDQGKTRLSLSLTQPLLDRSGQVYNERLLTQARLEADISWQEMRSEVEQRVADVVAAYWKLYELRCHLLQQNELLERGQRIEEVIRARRDFDAGRIELAKARQRVARRVDRRVQIEAEVKKQQARLASLVGSDELSGAGGTLEMIPLESPVFPDIQFNLRDAVLQGIENRPEVRAAATDLESAALSLQVTRAELAPQVTAVVEAYLAGLNGNYNVFQSLVDQVSEGSPGISGGLQYEMPRGRRAARSRHREAHHRYHKRSEDLREAIQLTRAEIETSLISVNTAMQQQRTKHRLLMTAINEERILTRRWEMMGGDGAAVGTVLENLLDAQQRRTDAEREWISSQSTYLSALVNLQRAMGTLLMRKGIQPVQERRSTTIHFIQDGGSVTDPNLHVEAESVQPLASPQTPPILEEGPTR